MEDAGSLDDLFKNVSRRVRVSDSTYGACAATDIKSAAIGSKPAGNAAAEKLAKELQENLSKT